MVNHHEKPPFGRICYIPPGAKMLLVSRRVTESSNSLFLEFSLSKRTRSLWDWILIFLLEVSPTNRKTWPGIVDEMKPYC